MLNKTQSNNQKQQSNPKTPQSLPINTPVKTFSLRKKLDIPPRGLTPGTYTRFTTETRKDAAGKESTFLDVLVTLNSCNKQGVPHQLSKSFNLDGRGATSFDEQFASWSGRPLTDEEMEEFPESLMLNQPGVFDIDHRGQGKKREAVITRFLPPDAAGQENS